MLDKLIKDAVANEFVARERRIAEERETRRAKQAKLIRDFNFMVAYGQKRQGPSFPDGWVFACNGGNLHGSLDESGPDRKLLMDRKLLLYVALMTGQAEGLADELTTEFFG